MWSLERVIKSEITHRHLFCCNSLLCCCARTVRIKDSISSPMQGWNLLAVTVCVGWQVTVVSTTLTMGSSQKISAPSCCVLPFPLLCSGK